ncbi:hypothetical protein [Ottowia sp.]|uniref:hypothetical protein n=1 Tax=Ottowia sp. TaxID=1898956 RepID=UPI0025F80504|nr:hypothetical protein [Ottowia sp.]MBK6616228.1 hypothetical protein [Ottowia sp.]
MHKDDVGDPMDAILWGQMYGRVRNTDVLQEVATMLVTQCALIQKRGGLVGEVPQRPQAGEHHEALRANLSSIFNDYLERLKVCLESSEGLTLANVKALRGFRSSLISRDAALAAQALQAPFFSGTDIDFAMGQAGLGVQEDVLRLLACVNEMGHLCRQTGVSPSGSNLVYWKTLCAYLGELSSPSSNDHETEAEVVEGCRTVAMTVMCIEAALLEAVLAFEVVPIAQLDAMGDWMEYAAAVVGVRTAGQQLEGFDEALVAEKVRQGVVKAWNHNEVVLRVDGTVTSKAHVISSLIRARVAAGSSVEAELERPWVELAENYFVLYGQAIPGVNVIAAEWCLQAVVRGVAQECKTYGVPGEVVEALVRSTSAKCMRNDLMWAAQGISVADALRCDARVDAHGEFWRRLSLDDVEEGGEQQTFDLLGMRAWFGMDSQLGMVQGACPTQGSLTVWDDSGEPVGHVEGRWFEATDGGGLGASAPGQYAAAARMLDDEFGDMAEALCVQLGEEAPAQATVFVCTAQRDAEATEPGLGAAMVASFVKHVKLLVPEIAAVAIKVEPAQYVFREWEGVPAPLLADRFAARSRLKRWCATHVHSALAADAMTRDLRITALENIGGRLDGSAPALDLKLRWKDV